MIQIRLINLSKSKNPFAEITSTKWVVKNQTIAGDSIIISVPYDVNGLTIKLETSFKGSCNKSLIKNIPLIAPPLADFRVIDNVCTGLIVRFENKSTDASEYEWNFNSPDESNIFKSKDVSPTFTFPTGGVYKVLLKSIRKTDGCFDTISKNIPVFENKIQPDFSIKLNGCDQPTDKLSVTLSDITGFNQPGYVLNKWEWTVMQNGKVVKYTGKEVNVLLSYLGVISVKLNVSASNGCSSELTKSIKIDDLVPELDFSFELTGCPTSESAEIKINNLSGPLNPFAKIDSSKWKVNGQDYTGNSILVRLLQNTGAFNVSLSTYFDEKCRVDLSKSFNLINALPKAAYKYQGVNCPTDENVRISLQFVDSLSRNIPFSQISWNAGLKDKLNPYSGSNIEVVLPKDSLLYFNMTANFTNGCSDKITGSFLPGPYATIKFSAEPLVLCPNESKNLIINSNPNWTYTWSPLSGLDLTDPKSPKVSVTKNTTYKITVNDGLCTVIDSIQVIALQGGIVLSIQSNNFTCDGKVTLTTSGGVGPGTYTWGTDANISQIIGTGQTINTSFSGKEKEYFVKFVGNSCSTEPAKIKITNQKPVITTPTPLVVCKEDTIQIFTLNDIPAHNNQFLWKTNSHIISGANTPRPTITIGAAEKDSFRLYYTVINQFNCKLEDSILVKITENPNMNFDINLKECGKYEVCFKISNTNYKGFLTWDFGDPSVSNDRSLENNPCYTYKEAGTYNVRLVNLVSVCPFKPIIKPVTTNPQVKLNQIRDTLICKGATINLSASSNIQNINYFWFNENGIQLFTGKTYTASFDKNTKLIIKAKDINGCSDSISLLVNVFNFQFAIEAKDSFCVNEQSQLKLNIQNPNDYIITWTPPDIIVSGGNTTTPSIIPVVDKKIGLLLKHKATGCIDSATITPKVTKPFFFTVKAPDILCIDVPTDVVLTIDNPLNYNYDWSPKDCIASGGNTVNPKVKISKDKVLTVKVTNKISGCSQTMNVNVKAGDKVSVDVDAKPDFTIFEGESLDLVVTNPINGAQYIWSTGASTITIKVAPKETTSYKVTVTDKNGCTASDEVTVTVRTAKCDETDIYLPNAFTPNNDGSNDVFRLRSNFIDKMELIIYNRWGQEIFRTIDKEFGWDGTFKNEELAPDTYAYYLNVLCVNKEVYSKRGNVNLLR